MTREQRLAIYLRGLEYKTVGGFYRLTPNQRRRLEKKWRRAGRPIFS
jgi:hypothetical protein